MRENCGSPYRVSAYRAGVRQGSSSWMSNAGIPESAAADSQSPSCRLRWRHSPIQHYSARRRAHPGGERFADMRASCITCADSCGLPAPGSRRAQGAGQPRATVGIRRIAAPVRQQPRPRLLADGNRDPSVDCGNRQAGSCSQIAIVRRAELGRIRSQAFARRRRRASSPRRDPLVSPCYLELGKAVASPFGRWRVLEASRSGAAR